MDYIVSVHALQEIAYQDLTPTLQELRRVLKPRGVMRLVLPDLLKGVAAYQRNDRDYFLVPDEDARSIGAKLVVQLLWHGYSRSVFTPEFIEEMLLKAGFSRVDHCRFKETESTHPGIIELDNREQESLFVEAVK
jgi:predicted SAM-dependent methyltransferase